MLGDTAPSPLQELSTYLKFFVTLLVLANGTSDGLPEFLESLGTLVRRETQVAHFGMGLLNRAGDLIYVEDPPQDSLLHAALPLSARHLLYSEVHVRNIQFKAQAEPFWDIFRGGQSALSVPLCTRQGSLGFLYAESPEPCSFSPEDVVALRLIGELIAPLLQKPVQPTRVEPNPTPSYHPLSQREIQVLRAVGEGQQNAEIARALHCKVRTVETHLTHIYRKLGVRGRVEALNTPMVKEILSKST